MGNIAQKGGVMPSGQAVFGKIAGLIGRPVRFGRMLHGITPVPAADLGGAGHQCQCYHHGGQGDQESLHPSHRDPPFRFISPER